MGVDLLALGMFAGGLLFLGGIAVAVAAKREPRMTALGTGMAIAGPFLALGCLLCSMM